MSKKKSLKKEINEHIDQVEENMKLYETTLSKFLKEEEDYEDEDPESTEDIFADEGDGELPAEDDLEEDEEMLGDDDEGEEEEVELSDDQMEELADKIADKVAAKMDGEDEDEDLDMDEDSDEDSEEDEDLDMEEDSEDEDLDMEESDEEDDEELEESVAIANFFDQDESLSEDFKNKAKFLFQKVVKEQVSSVLKKEKAKLKKMFEKKLVKNVESIKEDIISKTDAYLTEATNDWIEENKLAVENSTKVELAEQFLGNMKTLFVENYIEVPKEKEDLIESLEKTVVGLKDDLAKTLQKLKETREDNEVNRKNLIIEDQCADLTVPQRDKLKRIMSEEPLIEEKDFVSKINIIKESYFKNNKKKVIKDFEEEVSQIQESKKHDDISDAMKSYTQILDYELNKK